MEKTILPYLNVIEVESIERENVSRAIIIDKNDEVKALDISNIGSNNYQDLEYKPKINDVELNGNQSSDDLGLASKEELEGLAQELEEVKNSIPTDEYLDDYMDSKLENYYTKSETDDKIDKAVEDLAKKSEIPTKVSELENDLGYITDSALDGYATEEWVNGKFATKDDLDGKVDKDSIKDMLTKTEAESIYQKKGDYVTKIEFTESQSAQDSALAKVKLDLNDAVINAKDEAIKTSKDYTDKGLANKADKSDIADMLTKTVADKTYASKTEFTELQTKVEGKQDKLTPGNGINISGNKISVNYDALEDKPTLNGVEVTRYAKIKPELDVLSTPSKVTLTPKLGDQTGDNKELPAFNKTTNQSGILTGELYAELIDKYTKSEIDAIKDEINNKFKNTQEKLTPGQNISIVDGVISAYSNHFFIDLDVQPTVEYGTHLWTYLMSNLDYYVFGKFTYNGSVLVIPLVVRTSGELVYLYGYYFNGDNFIEVKSTLSKNGDLDVTVNDISTGTVLVPDGSITLDKLSEDLKQWIKDQSIKITVDDQLSNTSTNPVQNKVIKTKIDSIDSEINQLGSRVSSVEGTVSNIEGNISNIQNQIQQFEGDYVNKTELDNYYTKSQVDDKLSSAGNGDVLANGTLDTDKIILGSGNKTIKKSDVSLSDLATKIDLNSKADTGYVDSKVSSEIGKIDLSQYATKTELEAKQDKLTSGVNIKTINNQSLLGSGNIDIEGGGNNLIIDMNKTISAEEGKEIFNRIDTGDYTGFYVIDGSSLRYSVVSIWRNWEDYHIKYRYQSVLTKTESYIASNLYERGIAVYPDGRINRLSTTYEAFYTQLYDTKYLDEESNKITVKQVDISSATAKNQGLADAYDVKNYVDSKPGGIPTIKPSLTQANRWTGSNYTDVYNAIKSEGQSFSVFVPYGTEMVEADYTLATTSYILAIASISANDGTLWQAIVNYYPDGHYEISTSGSNKAVLSESGTLDAVYKIKTVTRSEYDSISSKDPNTMYLIFE